MNRQKLRLLILALALLCSIHAGAATVTFTAACPTCFTYYSPSYTDAGTGTVFSIATGGMDLTGKDYYGSGTYPVDFLIGSSDSISVANALTITLPVSTTSITIDLGAVFSSTAFTITLSDGDTFVVTPPGAYSVAPFTFTDSAGITSLSIATPAGETWVITDLTYSSVPEPGTLALLGGGALALAGPLRRKLLL